MDTKQQGHCSKNHVGPNIRTKREKGSALHHGFRRTKILRLHVVNSESLIRRSVTVFTFFTCSKRGSFFFILGIEVFSRSFKCFHQLSSIGDCVPTHGYKPPSAAILPLAVIPITSHPISLNSLNALQLHFSQSFFNHFFI